MPALLALFPLSSLLFRSFSFYCKALSSSWGPLKSSNPWINIKLLGLILVFFLREIYKIGSSSTSLNLSLYYVPVSIIHQFVPFFYPVDVASLVDHTGQTCLMSRV